MFLSINWCARRVFMSCPVVRISFGAGQVKIPDIPVIRFRALICAGLLLISLPGCTWLFLKFSPYADMVHPLVDPTSFGDSRYDMAINPYEWEEDLPKFYGAPVKPPKDGPQKTPQFASYVSEVNKVVFSKAKNLFMSYSSVEELRYHVKTANGTCALEGAHYQCVINRAIWEQDPETGKRATISASALCIRFFLTFPAETGVNLQDSNFRIERDHRFLTRKEDALNLQNSCL